MRTRYCGEYSRCLCFDRVRRLLWPLPYCGQLRPPVRQYGRARRPIRLSRTLRKPSYVLAVILAFALPNVSLSTHADIERLYGERKLLAERKPIPPSAVQYLQHAAAIEHAATTQRNRSSSATSVSSTDVSEETALDPDGPMCDRAAGLGNVTPGADTPTRTAKVTKHDLLNQYFRKDVVVWSNLDWFRCACPAMPH